VPREVIALPREVLVVQLGQAGPQDMLPTEEGVMGEDQPGDVHVQLVVPLGVRRAGQIQVCILGLQRLEGGGG